jgi:hypothetical protein
MRLPEMCEEENMTNPRDVHAAVAEFVLALIRLVVTLLLALR